MYDNDALLRVIEEDIQESLKVHRTLYDKVENIGGMVIGIENCFKKGNKLFVMGNGDSAALAQDIAREVRKFTSEELPYEAIALTTDDSVMIGGANYQDYLEGFAREVAHSAKRGDSLFGLSTSGNDENIIQAFEKGRELGTNLISFTGNGGGRIKTLSDLNINVDSTNTQRIQEIHMLVYHIILRKVERRIYAGAR